MNPLIVFSHLRWNFVYQRPQHLLARFAKTYQVHFIEEPVLDSGPIRWVSTSPLSNVMVHQPHTSEAAAGFDDRQLPFLQGLLTQLAVTYNLSGGVVWLYTPMALPLINALHPHTLVYDCMDELAAFNFAPLQIQQRERALLKRADLVFAGGPSLKASKVTLRTAIHCLPSSVDQVHFSGGRAVVDDPAGMHAGAHAAKLGFFGVIDERLDIPLLHTLASMHPDWNIDMIGPVVKIDPRSLPSLPNINYLGLRGYDELPALMRDWDVCLLPFALNDSTRFISPTKTLEYMAAGKPVVSTPVVDVVALYGNVVRVGAGLEFVHQCEAALAETATEKLERARAGDILLSQTSWDKTAAVMSTLLETAVTAAKANAAAGNSTGAAVVAGARTPPVIIIGAGPTGLSAAYHLGKHCLLLEQESSVGGWCRSLQTAGFTFDYAGHIMFSNDAYVHDMYKLLLGDNMHWQDREAWIFSKQVYTRYPFQGALYGLPPATISECLIGAIEARTGPLSKLGAVGPQRANLVAQVSAGDPKDLEVGTERAPADSRGSGADGKADPVHPNFEEFIYRTWGAGIAKHFAIPYNRKLWAVPLTSMETSWLGGRVPLPDLKDMIDGAIQPVSKPVGPNARFGYPLRGGFQALMNGFLPHLEGQLQLNASVVRVIPSRHRIVMVDGTILAYQQLISTMPLPTLIGMVGEEAPAQVRLAAEGLRHVSVRCVNLGIGRAGLTNKHWVYYPEDTVFHRIFVQGNASGECNPPGGFGITCEITYSPDKPLPCEGDDLIDLCIRDCIKVGMFNIDDPILTGTQIDMPYAYVIYDHARANNVKLIREWARAHDIVLAGRYSEWEYYNSDHAFIAGRNAANELLAAAKVGTAHSATTVPAAKVDERSVFTAAP